MKIEDAKSKKSVGVWLIASDGPLAGKVILQQRAEKENNRPQSSPFICQPTINEKLENRETLTTAIERGFREELGYEFAERFDYNSLVLFFVAQYSINGDQWVGYNFLGLVSQDQLNYAKVHSGMRENFVAIESADLEKIKSKKNGADPKKNIVLFQDQYAALLNLFRLKKALYFLK